MCPVTVLPLARIGTVVSSLCSRWRGAPRFSRLADQSRHKSMDALRGYVRDTEIFKDHAGDGLL
jgi:hypothetical protein